MEPARIPLARVKRVMKADPEVIAVSNDSVQLMAGAIQLFISHFTEQALLASRADGRSRISYKDFAQAANEHEDLAFLRRLIPKTVPFSEVKSKVDHQSGIPFARREEPQEPDEEDLSD